MGLGLLQGPAQASTGVCNVSDTRIKLYVASQEDNATTSQSWADIDPGACSIVYRHEDDSYDQFYRTSEPGFVGTGQKFCISTEDGFHLGDTEAAACSGPGQSMQEFRKIEPVAGEHTPIHNLDGSGRFHLISPMPKVDLSRPFVPALAAAPTDRPAERPGAGTDAALAEGDLLASGLVPGTYGPAFDLEAVWQGCDFAAAEAFCTFHAELWHFTARDGEAYPADYLDRLDSLAPGTPIRVRGDILAEGEVTAEVTLAEVTILPDTGFVGLFQAIQGLWQMSDQDGYQMRITGLEAIEFVDGEPVGDMFLQLRLGCAGSGGEGPTLTTLSLGDFQQRCFHFDALSDQEMVLVSEDRAERFVFLRR